MGMHLHICVDIHTHMYIYTHTRILQGFSYVQFCQFPFMLKQSRKVSILESKKKFYIEGGAKMDLQLFVWKII